MLKTPHLVFMKILPSARQNPMISLPIKPGIRAKTSRSSRLDSEIGREMVHVGKPVGDTIAIASADQAHVMVS